jgi:uncharacterized protein (DUF488 family)
VANPFFTIGHSTRTITVFVELLREADVSLVVDVRTVPRSRTNPQYNADVLPRSLAGFGIGCEHIAALGGLRGAQRDVSPATNAFWTHASFRNYADYALGSGFRAGFERLRSLGHERRCAVMCAEAVWWRCHRRIIADYLLASGETVYHILGPHHIEPARMTPAARPHGGGALSYPATSADEKLE